MSVEYSINNCSGTNNLIADLLSHPLRFIDNTEEREEVVDSTTPQINTIDAKGVDLQKRILRMWEEHTKEK
jgi:hypothetical protein